MTYLCTWPACKTAGCIDCNEAVELQDDDERDDDYADEEREPPEFGCCLPPGECCMPGLHLPSECHTAEDCERQHGFDWQGGWVDCGECPLINTGCHAGKCLRAAERKVE